MQHTLQLSIDIFLRLFIAVLKTLFATVTGDIVFFYASYYYLLLTLDCLVLISRFFTDLQFGGL